MEHLPETQKLCSRCKQLQPTSEFYKLKSKSCFSSWCKGCSREEARLRMALRHKINPESKKATDKKYRERNSEKIKEKKRIDYQKAISDPIRAAEIYAAGRESAKKRKEENPEKFLGQQRERNKRYREKNPEAFKARVRTYKKQEYAKNRQHFIAQQQKYRAKRIEAPGIWTGQDVLKLFQQQNACCFYCGRKLGWGYSRFCVDHFIPLSRGGTNHPHNLKLSCPTCNAQKYNKMPWEWMPDRFSPAE